ncbi:MAG: cache domain-containing protein [Magnetococcales bacterium]|nr:cache domain-containing protein [Magnetococcales bacterium]
MSESVDRLKLFSLFLGLTMIVPLVAYLIVQLNGPETRKNAFDNLRVIATLKADQIENWLGERQDDLELLANDEAFVQQVQRLLATGDPEAQLSVTKKLSLFSNSRYYNSARILSPSGRLVLAVGHEAGAWDSVTQHLPDVPSRHEKIMHSDLYQVSGHAYMSHLLLLANGSGEPPQAIVELQSPAETFLYAMLQTWPEASASGETLLVRREHDQVLYLNELRYQHDRVNLFQTGNDAESRRYCFCLDISDWLWYERLT